MANPTLTSNIKVLIQGLAQLDQLIQRLTQLGALSSQPIQVNTSSSTANIQQLSSAAEDAEFNIKGILTTLGTLAGAVFTFDFFKSAIESGIKFNAETETAKLGIASLIAAQGNLTDAAGKSLNATDALAVSQGLAADQLGKLRLAGLQTSATFGQLTSAYQGAVGVGLSVGLSLDQIRTTTIQITQAAGALGVPMEQLNQEVKAILSGQIDSNAVVASALGINAQMVAQWKEQNVLAEELNKKLEVFSASGELISKTYAASLSNVQEALDTVLGTATQGTFERLKVELNKFFDVIIDGSTGKIKESATGTIELLSSLFNGVGNLLGGTLGLVTDIFKNISLYINENRDDLTELENLLSDLGATAGAVVKELVSLFGTVASSTGTKVAIDVLIKTATTFLDIVEVILETFGSLPEPIQDLVVTFGILKTLVIPLFASMLSSLGAIGVSTLATARNAGLAAASWTGANVQIQRQLALQAVTATTAAATELRAAEAALASARAIQASTQATYQVSATAANLAAVALENAKVNQALAAQQAAAARVQAAANAAIIAQERVRLAQTAATAGLLSNAINKLGIPVVLTIIAGSVYAAVKGVEALADKLYEVSDANQKLKKTMQDNATEFTRLSILSSEEAKSYKEFADVKIKTAEELGKLDAKEIAGYADKLSGREKLEKATLRSLQLERQAVTERLALAKSSDANSQAVKTLTAKQEELNTAIEAQSAKYKEVSDALASVAARSDEFASRIENGSVAAIKNLSDKFQEVINKGNDVKKALEEVTKGLSDGKVDVGSVTTILNTLKKLQDEGKITSLQLSANLSSALANLDTNQLNQFEFAATQAFNTTKDSAETTTKAIESIRVALDAAKVASEKKLGINVTELATNVTEATRTITEGITAYTNSFVNSQDLFKQQLALSNTEVIARKEELVKAFNDTARQLTTLAKTDTGRFAVSARLVEIQKEMQELDRQGVLTAEQFKTLQDRMQADATKTSLVLRDAFSKGINSAKTSEDLALITQNINQAKEAGAIMGDDLSEVMLQLSDKSRQLAGVIEGALGESFKRIGIKGSEALKALAEQAQVDLQRIVDSGLATNGELVASYKKVADTASQVAESQAVSISRVANEAELMRTRIQNAASGVTLAFREMGTTPLNELKANLNNVQESFNKVHDSGLLTANGLKKAWEEYAGKLVEVQGDTIGTALRVQAAAEGVALNIADAWSRMGVRTRAEMVALAATALSDFETIATSGQATAQTLATAYEKYAKALIDANGGLDENTKATLKATATQYGFVDAYDKLIDKQEEAANNLRDSFTEATEQVGASIAGLLNSMGSAIGKVSQKAQALFNDFITGSNNATNSVDPLQARLQQLETILSTPRDVLKSGGSFGYYLDTLNKKAAELEAQAIRDQLAVRKIDEAVQGGDKSSAQLQASLGSLIRSSKTLDDQTLDRLRGQLNDARNATLELRNAALSVIDSLDSMGDSFKEQLLRAKGDVKELESIEYQRKLKELEAKRDEALRNPQASPDIKNEANAAFARAKAQLDELHKFNLAEIDAKIAEDQARREAELKQKEQEDAQRLADELAAKEEEQRRADEAAKAQNEKAVTESITKETLISQTTDLAKEALIGQVDALQSQVSRLLAEKQTNSTESNVVGNGGDVTLIFQVDGTNLLSEDSVRRNILPVIEKYVDLRK